MRLILNTTIMEPTITISRTTGTRALLAALFAVIVLLVTRTVKNALVASGYRLSTAFMARTAIPSSAPAGSSSATTSLQQ